MAFRFIGGAPLLAAVLLLTSCYLQGCLKKTGCQRGEDCERRQICNRCCDDEVFNGDPTDFDNFQPANTSECSSIGSSPLMAQVENAACHDWCESFCPKSTDNGHATVCVEPARKAGVAADFELPPPAESANDTKLNAFVSHKANIYTVTREFEGEMFEVTFEWTQAGENQLRENPPPKALKGSTKKGSMLTLEQQETFMDVGVIVDQLVGEEFVEAKRGKPYGGGGSAFATVRTKHGKGDLPPEVMAQMGGMYVSGEANMGLMEMINVEQPDPEDDDNDNHENDESEEDNEEDEDNADEEAEAEVAEAESADDILASRLEMKNLKELKAYAAKKGMPQLVDKAKKTDDTRQSLIGLLVKADRKARKLRGEKKKHKTETKKKKTKQKRKHDEDDEGEEAEAEVVAAESADDGLESRLEMKNLKELKAYAAKKGMQHLVDEAKKTNDTRQALINLLVESRELRTEKKKHKKQTKHKGSSRRKKRQKEL